MDGRIKPWRLVYAIALGLALGGVFGILIARVTPICPKVEIAGSLDIPSLATTTRKHAPQTVDTPEAPHASLLFVGDIMLDRTVRERMRAARDPEYPFKRLPDNWFNAVDLAVANLEGPVTDRRRPPEKTIDFQFDPSVIETLKMQGLDAFSHANNHALDQGAVGYQDSVNRLRAAGFLVFGHQVEDDEMALATTTIRDTRYAFLGFNTTDNPLDKKAASTTIALARSHTDVVIVYMHWGTEYRNKPDPASIDLAHWLIDHGVDIVIGTHPHWVQGISTYKNKPIVWSLGNFIFDQDWSVETRRGLAIEIRIDREIQIIPIPLQINASQPQVLEGEERIKRLRELAQISDRDLVEQIESGMLRWPRYAAGAR